MLDRLFRRTACPMPQPGQRRACVRPQHFATTLAGVAVTYTVGVLAALRR